MRRATVLFLLCIAMLAGLLVLRNVDPAIALDPGVEVLRAGWAYLEFALYAVIIATAFATYKAFRVWFNERRTTDRVAGLAMAAVAGMVVVLTERPLIERYTTIADSMFASARGDLSNREFGNSALSRKDDLNQILASGTSAVRRIRALPRYSLYDYEVTPSGSREPFFVSMTIEASKPKLTINLRSDLVPTFEEPVRRKSS